MKTAALFTLCLAMFTSWIKNPAFGREKTFLYAGTFTERGSLGIYVFQFDENTGKLKPVQIVEGKESPSFLALNKQQNMLYAVYREGVASNPSNGTVMAYSVHPDSGTLTKVGEITSGGKDPCHISVDPKNRFVYISHYSEGTFAAISLSKDGALDRVTDVLQHTGRSQHPTRQNSPHVHSAVPSKNGDRIYVSDLGTDKVYVYSMDNGTGKIIKLSETAVQPGSGPRHFTLHPSGRYAYLAEELSSTVSCYQVDRKSGALQFLQRSSTLPENFDGTNSVADIHTDPSGNYLYTSNRGHNSLAIHAIDASTGKVSYTGNTDVKGIRPRNFLMHPQGQFVFVANRESDEITIFKCNSESGTVIFTGQRAAVPAVVCLKIAQLK